MHKMAVTGLSGFIGQRLTKLADANSLIDLYHRRPIKHPNVSQSIKLNLLSDDVASQLSQIDPDVIIHMAAATHIDVCQQDAINGRSGLVWKLNVEATAKIVDYCQQNQKRLIFLSTECVFDGHQKSYDEDDQPNPKNWYGQTKAEAEEIVKNSQIEWAIVRGVVAYHPVATYHDIVHQLKTKLDSEDNVQVVADQNFTPTFVDDLVKAIQVISNKNLTGIFHVVSPQVISPYDLAVLVANKYQINTQKIKSVRMNEFFGIDAQLRLKNAVLDGAKSRTRLGFVPKTPLEAFEL